MWVTEPSRDLDLSGESIGTDQGRKLGLQNLEGDVPPVPEVPGEIDDGHPSLTELALDLVAVGQCRLQIRQDLSQGKAFLRVVGDYIGYGVTWILTRGCEPPDLLLCFSDMDLSANPPKPKSRGAYRRLWRILTKVLIVGVWVFLLIQLAPHLAAVVGVETGGGVTPDFEVSTLDGASLTNADLEGKVVLVNFWATWCPPCRVEMPLLQRMADRHREAGLVVLGLSRDVGTPEKVRAFLDDRGITYPVAIVGRDAEQRFGGVRGYPTSFLLDRSGRIRHKALGPLAMLSFEPAVRRLLAEPIAGVRPPVP